MDSSCDLNQPTNQTVEWLHASEHKELSSVSVTETRTKIDWNEQNYVHEDNPVRTIELLRKLDMQLNAFLFFCVVFGIGAVLAEIIC